MKTTFSSKNFSFVPKWFQNYRRVAQLKDPSHFHKSRPQMINCRGSDLPLYLSHDWGCEGGQSWCQTVLGGICGSFQRIWVHADILLVCVWMTHNWACCRPGCSKQFGCAGFPGTHASPPAETEGCTRVIWQSSTFMKCLFVLAAQLVAGVVLELLTNGTWRERS